MHKDELFECVKISTEQLKEAGANYDERLLDDNQLDTLVNSELDRLYKNDSEEKVIYYLSGGYISIYDMNALEMNKNRIIHFDDALRKLLTH